MVTSDWIQAGIGSVAAITSIIAVAISISTLRQSAKIIEAEARPYITVYYTEVYDASFKGYFAVKNFGKTGAEITRFQFSPTLEDGNLVSQAEGPQLPNLVGLYLAPGQSQLVTYIPADAPPQAPCSFIISFEAGKRKYVEAVKIDVATVYRLNRTNANDSSLSKQDENKPPPDMREIARAGLRDLSYDLQEIVRRMV